MLSMTSIATLSLKIIYQLKGTCVLSLQIPIMISKLVYKKMEHNGSSWKARVINWSEKPAAANTALEKMQLTKFRNYYISTVKER